MFNKMNQIFAVSSKREEGVGGEGGSAKACRGNTIFAEGSFIANQMYSKFGM